MRRAKIGMSTRAVLSLFLFLACIASPNTGNAGATEPPMVLGVGVHLWGSGKNAIDRHLDAVEAANLKIIRWDAPWKAVETVKDQLVVPANWDYIVDRARLKGIECLLILDYGNKFYDNADKPISKEAVAAFARYSAFVARHFAGRVRYLQIWNEWNGRVGDTKPGKTKDYVELVKATYPAIKAANPSAFVISGSFSSGAYNSLIGYVDKNIAFDEFLNSGVAEYGDGISIHPYVVYRDGYMQTYDGFVELLNKVVSRIRSTPGFEKKPIFITELGWTTARPHPKGVSEDVQAKHLIGAIELARGLGISALLMYELHDGNAWSNDAEGNFGLVRNDWTPKPSYQAVRKVAE